jgi:S1-C subfamily serine protease
MARWAALLRPASEQPGALVDRQGQIVGIPTLAVTDEQIGGAAAGIGFPIPSDIVKGIADQLITSVTVTTPVGRPWVQLFGGSPTTRATVLVWSSTPCRQERPQPGLA